MSFCDIVVLGYHLHPWQLSPVQLHLSKWLHYSLFVIPRTWLPVPGNPCKCSSDNGLDASSIIPLSGPVIRSWKLCQRDAMVSYSLVIPRTSSSLRLRLLLDGSNDSNPWSLRSLDSSYWSKYYNLHLLFLQLIFRALSQRTNGPLLFVHSFCFERQSEKQLEDASKWWTVGVAWAREWRYTG